MVSYEELQDGRSLVPGDPIVAEYASYASREKLGYGNGVSQESKHHHQQTTHADGVRQRSVGALSIRTLEQKNGVTFQQE